MTHTIEDTMDIHSRRAKAVAILGLGSNSAELVDMSEIGSRTTGGISSL